MLVNTKARKSPFYRHEEKAKRIKWLREYKEQTGADKKTLIKIAMTRWELSMRTARDYVIIIT